MTKTLDPQHEAMDAEEGEAHAALRASLERFDLMVRGSRDGMWDGAVVRGDAYNLNNPIYFSPRFKEILGFEEHEFDGNLGAWYAVLHAADRDRVMQALDDHLYRRVPYDIECRVRRKNGDTCWVEVRGQALWDADGQPLRLSGSMRDITERKRAEENLRASHEDWRSLVSNTASFIIKIDLAGEILFINRVLDHYEMSEVVGRSVFELHPPETAAIIRATLERLVATSESQSYEVRGEGPNRAMAWYEARMSPIFADGRVAAATIEVVDVTARRLAEERVRRHEAELTHMSRLTAMGELAAQIAHEINQPLSAIASFTHACVRRLAALPGVPAEIPATMDKVAAQAARAGEIIKRIRRLIQKHTPVRGPLLVNELLRSVMELFAEEARQQEVEVVWSLDAMLPSPPGDQVQIEQVIVNLVRNALQAMVATRFDARRLTLSTRMDGAMVVVGISDTGDGAAGDLDAIFEPFYTTKATGLGMGLSISRSIVEVHAGRLWATRNEGAGMTFQFALPTSADEESPGAS